MKRPERETSATPLDQALARAGDGAFGIDGSARITSWNRAAEEILGYGAPEVIGRRCCEVFAGHDTEGNRVCYPGCRVMTLVEMDEPVRHFDLRARTRAGRPVWLDMSILATTSPAGEPLTIHLFRDVTATKELLTLIHERLAPGPAAPDAAAPAAALSRRELEVLRCMREGLNTRATAQRLAVSPATVRNHVQNIFGKLGVHSRLEAVAFATKHRLL
ncbi:MAG TPA: LuxR C-terminal-related transcriptional regulator [Methylomirabilota bacterium]|nr:LuxR C-terminal-related transcriptional regulator [Methylomirabilota bacterium]